MGWVVKRRFGKLGGSDGRGKRREDFRVGGKGWEIITHILRYLLENVDN